MVNTIVCTIETKLKNLISKNNDLTSGISFARNVHKIQNYYVGTKWSRCSKEDIKIENETLRTPPPDTNITNETK